MYSLIILMCLGQNVELSRTDFAFVPTTQTEVVISSNFDQNRLIGQFGTLLDGKEFFNKVSDISNMYAENEPALRKKWIKAKIIDYLYGLENFHGVLNAREEKTLEFYIDNKLAEYDEAKKKAKTKAKPVVVEPTKQPKTPVSIITQPVQQPTTYYYYWTYPSTSNNYQYQTTTDCTTGT